MSFATEALCNRSKINPIRLAWAAFIFALLPVSKKPFSPLCLNDLMDISCSFLMQEHCNPFGYIRQLRPQRAGLILQNSKSERQLRSVEKNDRMSAERGYPPDASY